MFIVIVSAWLRKIEPAICELGNAYIVKKEGTKLFIYIDTDEEISACIKRIKNYLREKLTAIIVFEIYSIYNGKEDIIQYLPDEMKQSSDYYNSTKDLSLEEEEQFFNAHPDLKRK